MDKVIITVAGDSSVTFPINHYCPKPVRENVGAIVGDYQRAIDAGAAIAHLHGVWKEESDPDGARQAGFDIEGWGEITSEIRSASDAIVQFGISLPPIPARRPLLDLEPDMLSVTYNAHDAYLHPNEEFPPATLYGLHTHQELDDYAELTKSLGIAIEAEVFHTGSIWNLNWQFGRGVLSKPQWATVFMSWPGGGWTPPTEPALLYIVENLPDWVVWNTSVMHPEAQWRLLSLAIGLGGHVRVGYEDNPYIEPGILADSNARLVEKVVRIAEAQGRGVASPSEARALLEIPQRKS